MKRIGHSGEKFTTRNGVEVLPIHPDKASDITPVALVPGVGTGPKDMNPRFIRELSSDRSVYIINTAPKIKRSLGQFGIFAGFLNVGSPEHFVRELSRSADEIADKAGLDDLNGVGYSRGGTDIDRAARTNEKLFDKISTISSPAGTMSPNMLTQFDMVSQALHDLNDTKSAALAARILGISLEKFREIGHETSFGTSPSRPITNQQNFSGIVDHWYKLAGLYSSAPLENGLYINGQFDPIAPPERTAHLVDLDKSPRPIIPLGVRAVAIANQGHPLPSTRPEQMADLIKRHFDGTLSSPESHTPNGRSDDETANYNQAA